MGIYQCRNKPSSLSSPYHILQTLTIQDLRTVDIISIGVSNDWYATLDMLKESCRIASSVNWSDVDLSQFQGEYGFFLTYNQKYMIPFSLIDKIFFVVEINISLYSVSFVVSSTLKNNIAKFMIKSFSQLMEQRIRGKSSERSLATFRSN